MCDKICRKKIPPLYFYFSVNSQINATATNKINTTFDLEIPKGKWTDCCIEEGFVVVRIPQSYQLTQMPTSFQLIAYNGTNNYIGDNQSNTDIVGVFLIDVRTDISLSGNNDLYSYSFKLLEPVKLANVNNNLKLALVGRVINATFPTTNELFVNEQYKNGLYFMNWSWNPTNCYSACYMKIKFSN
jgi:hypothetical protein